MFVFMDTNVFLKIMIFVFFSKGNTTEIKTQILNRDLEKNILGLASGKEIFTPLEQSPCFSLLKFL